MLGSDIVGRLRTLPSSHTPDTAMAAHGSRPPSGMLIGVRIRGAQRPGSLHMHKKNSRRLHHVSSFQPFSKLLGRWYSPGPTRCGTQLRTSGAPQGGVDQRPLSSDPKGENGRFGLTGLLDGDTSSQKGDSAITLENEPAVRIADCALSARPSTLETLCADIPAQQLQSHRSRAHHSSAGGEPTAAGHSSSTCAPGSLPRRLRESRSEFAEHGSTRAGSS